MKITVAGCGLVFDVYMRTFKAHAKLTITGLLDLRPERIHAVSQHYGFRTCSSLDDLLAGPEVETVTNLTSITSHFEASHRALEAGRQYSEEPLTTDFEHRRRLHGELQPDPRHGDPGAGAMNYGAPQASRRPRVKTTKPTLVMRTDAVTLSIGAGRRRMDTLPAFWALTRPAPVSPRLHGDDATFSVVRQLTA